MSMITVNWKHGLVIDINVEIGNLNSFLILIGDKDFPYNSREITNGMFAAFFEKHYIEYNIKIYECNKKTNRVLLLHEAIFNTIGKNFYFELLPNSQEELDIWMDYLINFSEIKKCNLFIKKIDTLNFKSHDTIKLVNDESEIDFYAKYKISWDEDLNYNPAGLYHIDYNRISSYDLINNCLLKI